MEFSFTEAQTEAFYDAEDAHYRSFWDRDGSLHWGFFDRQAARPEDFVAACDRWSTRMLEQSGIDAGSRVLDVGCGNGTTALWLARTTGCEVVGIDLSGVRIANARAKAASERALRATFEKASATRLPFPDASFTHVWSQATLYHTHDRPAALREVHRVLAEGGTFLLDDLVTPRSDISERGRRFVYERLLFTPTFSHRSYAQALTDAGFMVCRHEDLRRHLRTSYALLRELARPAHPSLSDAYEEMCAAIDRSELGWSFFLADKVTNRLDWVYTPGGTRSLAEKYDGWSRSYDRDLADAYGACPRAAAAALAKACPERTAAILDAGCGTGMTGAALAQLGYTDLTGLDASAGMLDVAAGKGVYRRLVHHDLESAAWLPAAGGAGGGFGAVVATGVFTFAHAAPSTLLLVDRALAPGGAAVITVRRDYESQTPAFAAAWQAAGWRLAARDPFVVFGDEAMDALTFVKPGPS